MILPLTGPNCDAEAAESSNNRIFEALERSFTARFDIAVRSRFNLRVARKALHLGALRDPERCSGAARPFACEP
jgi:hypothetical protein